VDIVGPLPRSRSDNHYVLVICNYATRYPEAVPLRCIDVENVAEELIKLFAQVQNILTDQGSNFTSKLLMELYRLLRVKAILTSPYHPQTDGLVEWFNQTLKRMLRKVTAIRFFLLTEKYPRLLQDSHLLSYCMDVVLEECYQC